MTNYESIKQLSKDEIADILEKIFNEDMEFAALMNKEIFYEECDRCPHCGEEGDCFADYNEDCPTSNHNKALEWLNKEIL